MIDKQIEEMAKVLSPYYDFCKITKCENCNRKKLSKCRYYSFAKRYVMNGYRKQSDTAREVIIKLLSIIQNEYEYYPDGMTLGTYAQLRKEINELAAEYSVEMKDD